MALLMPDFANTNPDPANDLAALRQRVEVLDLVLRESTDPIFNILEDGTYQFVNQAFSRAFQREPEDIIGKKIWDIFSAEEAEKRMIAVR
ncbi:MAG: PAS domain-containing protein, partial [Holophaga sp.]|nr:PAS domain-containing protein [Holophaga sp.]